MEYSSFSRIVVLSGLLLGFCYLSSGKNIILLKRLTTDTRYTYHTTQYWFQAYRQKNGWTDGQMDPTECIISTGLWSIIIESHFAKHQMETIIASS